MNETSQPSNRRCSQRSQDLQQAIPNTRRMRRIRSLFWDNDTMYSTAHSDSNQLIAAEVVPCGRIKLKRVHSSPHLYLVDDFLTHKELEYLHTSILAAERRKDFERSFVDGEQSSSEDEIPTDNIKTDESSSRNETFVDEEGYSDNRKNPVEEHSITNDPVTENNLNQKLVPNIEAHHGASINSRKRKRSHRRHDQHRTSRFIHFSKMASKHIASIESRAADLFHLPHHCVEPIQLVKYIPGQFFNVHHDLGVMTLDETEDARGETDLHDSQPVWESNSVHISLPPRPNALCPPRRLLTVLVYLNDLPNTCCSCVTKETNIPTTSYCHAPSCYTGFHVTGGSTFFPLLNHGQGLRIIPKQGQALIWCNITRDGLPDKRLIHSGEAIRIVRSKEVEKEEAVEVSNAPRGITDSAWVNSTIFPIKYALNVWVCEE